MTDTTANAEGSDGSTPNVPAPSDISLPAKRLANRSDEFGPPAVKGERLEEWMLTYMDTVTLLVTLFVLILSFASISEEKYRALAEGLRLDKYGSGVVSGSTGIMDMPGTRPQVDALAPAKPEGGIEAREDVTERLEDFIARKGLNDLVKVEISDGLLDLQLQDSVLFPSGSAVLLDKGRDVLSRLDSILASGDFDISVHGHTDSVPISTPDFPTNWELSGDRAAAVVRALIGMGIDEKRLSTAGFAHTRPVGDNATAEGRAMNRRVNIQLHASADEIEQILGD